MSDALFDGGKKKRKRKVSRARIRPRRGVPREQLMSDIRKLEKARKASMLFPPPAKRIKKRRVPPRPPAGFQVQANPVIYVSNHHQPYVQREIQQPRTDARTDRDPSGPAPVSRPPSKAPSSHAMSMSDQMSEPPTPSSQMSAQTANPRERHPNDGVRHIPPPPRPPQRPIYYQPPPPQPPVYNPPVEPVQDVEMKESKGLEDVNWYQHPDIGALDKLSSDGKQEPATMEDLATVEYKTEADRGADVPTVDYGGPRRLEDVNWYQHPDIGAMDTVTKPPKTPKPPAPPGPAGPAGPRRLEDVNWYQHPDIGAMDTDAVTKPPKTPRPPVTRVEDMTTQVYGEPRRPVTRVEDMTTQVYEDARPDDQKSTMDYGNDQTVDYGSQQTVDYGDQQTVDYNTGTVDYSTVPKTVPRKGRPSPIQHVPRPATPEDYVRPRPFRTPSADDSGLSANSPGVRKQLRIEAPKTPLRRTETLVTEGLVPKPPVRRALMPPTTMGPPSTAVDQQRITPQKRANPLRVIPGVLRPEKIQREDDNLASKHLSTETSEMTLPKKWKAPDPTPTEPQTAPAQGDVGTTDPSIYANAAAQPDTDLPASEADFSTDQVDPEAAAMVTPAPPDTAPPDTPQSMDGQGQHHGKQVRALYNDEIEQEMTPFRKDGFAGVIPSDKIETLVPDVRKADEMSFIMNTDPSTKPGKHWVAVWITFVNGRDHSWEACYYDPLGDPPTQKTLEGIKELLESRAEYDHTLPSLKMKINLKANQKATTNTCGYHSMRFIADMASGKSFQEATDYTQKDAEAIARRMGLSKVPIFGYI
jgi:hypothetical protein